MIDTAGLLQKVDIAGLIEGDLGAGKKSGRWLLFSCPFPGHAHGDRKPSLAVTPDNGRYYCFTCGKSGDAITWLMDHRGLDFKRACEALGGQDALATKRRPDPPSKPAYAAPDAEWQAVAGQVLTECQGALWGVEGARALEYLRRRGLQDETIRHFRLGYNPTDHKAGGHFWMDRGIVLPCQTAGQLWYLKVRRAAEDPKYRCMSGSRPDALFNGEDLPGQEIALFVEGEFDCMIAAQQLTYDPNNYGIPAVTFGSATNLPDLATWGPYLLTLKDLLIAYDADPAGRRGAARLAGLSDRVIDCPLPEGTKDINDYFLAGGDLWEWIQAFID
jgi:hypothetical protein